MPFISGHSIEALAHIISGGPGTYGPPPIGNYRSAYHLQKFMKACGVNFTVSGSRVPSLVDRLTELNELPNAETTIKRIIEHAADPRDFMEEPSKLSAVIEYLNNFLVHDRLELQHEGRIVRLKTIDDGPVLSSLAHRAKSIDFDTVRRDLDRALDSAEKDPEDAVTAACSVVESVCRSVLAELSIDLPPKKDIQHLYRAVREPLGLNPDRSDVSSDVADDVRKILSGLTTCVEGIGSLRTHAGDAHGRERGHKRLDPRIARLSVHAASTLALFVVETWQRKYPSKPLLQAPQSLTK